ncbi:TRAP transporter large permease [Aurantimonas sp. C2-6-R+9]|uniref:TRAP transporter large permease n=1 Tax=unclassified Aurantimonas TaxID=2638230 RepID=UPI002E174F8E|nr:MULTISPECIES: TRAP transporter large permease [unclassified Aurantimonas]MEC5289962.1 TRAP transporter large permease [Aurantimonas sp. C2-3-R2]MEC5322661.1 TRAP transporter large permease [Aurantimonas sp. A3-2-R12]MEC5381184.1 TRAP transporter large permease [Aurantimonas sp. C2-6-R+9]MEC5411027.1 TRAP transporter large permease [Aurantimonas sp. C2-4-R8]
MSSFMLLALVGFFALGLPIAIAIAAASIGGLVFFTSLPLLVVAQQLMTKLDSFPLMAVPFFILAGNLMEAAGISGRLVEFAKTMVGGVRGGLACSCVLTCMIFAAVSGSSVATTFAIGAIVIPAMTKHGYPTGFAAALQATSAELGVIIPPSIPLILYGVSAEVSIGDLFIAGLGPGLLIGLALILFVYVYCRKNKWGERDHEGRLPFWQSLKAAFLALLMPIVIIGGIYDGIFTPTEASVIAVFYALFIGMAVYRTISPRDLLPVLHRSVISSTIILFVIAAAGLFSFLITRAGVPAAIGEWLGSVMEDPLYFLLAVNAFLFIAGMFIETSAAIIVLAPILAPVAVSFGIDPVHFGLIMVVNLALGMITPPFGVNLFAACQVARIPFEQIVPRLLPFVLVIIACLLVISYVPAISVGLLTLL